MTKVLVAEKVGASGIDLLKAHFDVDTAFDADGFDFEARIGEYDGLLIRSATKMTADLIDKATNLKAIGRAGVGVDNVDVLAATKRGIIVANAPESNVVTAAEHTMALLLALARNVPQAHAALSGEGKEQRERVLGRRHDVGLRRVGDDDPALGGGRDVDVVNADAGAADGLQVGGLVDEVGRHLGGRPDQQAVVLADAGLEVEALDVERGVDVEVRLEEVDAGGADLLGDEDARGAVVGAHAWASTTKSMHLVSWRTSSGSIAGNMPMRSWLRPSLR